MNLLKKKDSVKVYFFFIFIILFSNFISASVNNWRCVDNGITIGYKDQPIIKQGENYFFSVHTYNSSTGTPLNIGNSFCALHLYNQSGSHIIINNNISFGLTSYDFFLNILGENFSEVGSYPLVVACIGNSGIESGVCSSSIEVTPSGEDYNFYTLVGYIFLAFILIIFILGLSSIKEKVNKDKLESRIKSLYENRNTTKLFFYSALYQMVKQTYFTNYLIGFLILVLLRYIIWFYNFSDLLLISDIVLGIYAIASIVVSIVFFGHIQEWLVKLKEDFSDMNYGEGK